MSSYYACGNNVYMESFGTSRPPVAKCANPESASLVSLALNHLEASAEIASEVTAILQEIEKIAA